MGILDALKRLLPKGEPPSVLDPQCARNSLLTIRLPIGWQFTEANERHFAASGPGGCSVTFSFRLVNRGTQQNPKYLKPEDVDGNRDEILKLVRSSVFKIDAKEMNGPDGILWLEANDVQGQNRRLQVAVVNSKPRDPTIDSAPLLHVTCTMPVTSAAGDFSAERFEAVR